MKKKLIIVAIVLVLITGCVKNKEEKIEEKAIEKMKTVLNDNGYNCDNNICHICKYDDDEKICKYVNFNMYKFIMTEYNDNDLPLFDVTGTYEYCWKNGDMAADTTTAYGNIIKATLDRNGVFNYTDDGGISNFILKRYLLDLKQEFNDFLIQADVEIEEIS